MINVLIEMKQLTLNIILGSETHVNANIACVRGFNARFYMKAALL